MTGSKDDQVLYLWHYHSQTEKKGGIYMIIAIISIAVLAADDRFLRGCCGCRCNRQQISR